MIGKNILQLFMVATQVTAIIAICFMSFTDGKLHDYLIEHTWKGCMMIGVAVLAILMFFMYLSAKAQEKREQTKQP